MGMQYLDMSPLRRPHFVGRDAEKSDTAVAGKQEIKTVTTTDHKIISTAGKNQCSAGDEKE